MRSRLPVSLHRDDVANRLFWHSAQAMLTAIFQDQLNGGGHAGAAFLHRASLTIGSRNFRRPANEPLAILFDYRREFVVHVAMIPIGGGRKPTLSQPPLEGRIKR